MSGESSLQNGIEGFHLISDKMFFNTITLMKYQIPIFSMYYGWICTSQHAENV